MKKVLFTIVAIILSANLALAQNCSQFISAVNGKKLVYSNLDTKGKESGKMNFTTTKKSGSTVAVHTEVFDKNAKSIGTSDSEMSCDGETIKVDMKSFVPAASVKQFSNMQMQGDVKYLVYPLNLKAGQALPDGTADIIINNNGSHMGDINMEITNRKVEQQETLSLPAGSFDCYKITYATTIKVKMMGIGFPVHMQVTEWFSPKLGRMVKSETYTKNGKLAGTTQLESIN